MLPTKSLTARKKAQQTVEIDCIIEKAFCIVEGFLVCKGIEIEGKGSRS